MSADSSDVTPPVDEVAALRAEVARLRYELDVTLNVLDTLPFGVFWKDLTLTYRGANRLTLAAGGYSERSGYLGKTDAEMPWTREQAEAYVAADRQVLATRQPKQHIVESIRDRAGEVHWVETFKAPLYDPAGELFGLVGTFRDITARKLAEDSAAAEQRAALQALATPLLPVADGVVVLPLIGALDAERLTQIMETLLAGVVHHRAAVAIVDITGLRAVDSTAADGLVRAARAIRLLGAEAVLTGVGPAVAQTLVALGADLQDLVVLGDLKAGIAHALGRRPAR